MEEQSILGRQTKISLSKVLEEVANDQAKRLQIKEGKPAKGIFSSEAKGILLATGVVLETIMTNLEAVIDQKIIQYNTKGDTP